MADAARLLKEVETSLAAGARLDKDGSVYAKLEDELSRLREDNDRIIAQVETVKQARAACVAQEEQLVGRMRDGGAIDGEAFAVVLRKIEEFDNQVAGLRSQQLENSKDISNLKRGRVRIEQRSEVAGVLAHVSDAVADGSTADVAALEVRVSALLDQLLDAFDGHSHSVQKTKKDIDGAINKLRSLALALRVRRGRVDAEVDALRGELVSSLFAAQRKNAKLTRLRDMQALLGKEIGLLERALDGLRWCGRVRGVVAEGGAQKIEEEVAVLLRDIEAAREAVQALEGRRESFAEEGRKIVAALRAPELLDSVNARTGELREQLIAALREEELAAARLAALRSEQALRIRLLGELRAVST